VIRNSACTITGLTPGTVYHIGVMGLDTAGYPVTSLSEEVRTRTLALPDTGLCRVAELSLLIPIYTDGFTDDEMEAMIKGFELARLFFFRNSRARLNLCIHYLRLPGRPGVKDATGMSTLEKDLRDRGVLNLSFDAVHVVSKDLEENCSGYLFTNGAVGSMGVTAEAPFPDADPTVDYRACWTLVHEFQHTLDHLAAQAESMLPMLSGHFLDNYPQPSGAVFDAGDFYAGQGEILRQYEGYLALPCPVSQCIETLDRDGDGLPDHDRRLPLDEFRFGSDPGKLDSDGDGLDDLEEFCAGLYGGSDPLDRDTDRDGLTDGADPYPLSRFYGVIPYGTPKPGQIPKGLLSEGVFHSTWKAMNDLSVHASWNEEALYLCFDSSRPLSIEIQLDGSGHLGRFESDRCVLPAGPDREADQPGSDVYAEDAALGIAFGSPTVRCGPRLIEGARVLSAERDGRRILWLCLPSALGTGTRRCHIRSDAKPSKGLTLEADRILGFSFNVFPMDRGAGRMMEEKEGACYVYEAHRFYDARLER
jgi:hypothetical protein